MAEQATAKADAMSDRRFWSGFVLGTVLGFLLGAVVAGGGLNLLT